MGETTTEKGSVNAYIQGSGGLDAEGGKILGKNYFRDTEVNEGFYSKKREGVADVDPKVKYK